MGDPTISDTAINLIIAAEVTNEATYIRLYQRPTWPGESSGVTIGIGYDCGYVSARELEEDWRGLIPAEMVAELRRLALGVTGASAEARTEKLRSDGTVIVPWVAAIAEFRRTEMPKWIARTAAALPHTSTLHPDCLGALVSLAYNRGASFDLRGARFAEMRAIKAHMTSGELSRIPAEIRSMSRLWPRTRGLRLRREDEARLFEQGLAAQREANGRS